MSRTAINADCQHLLKTSKCNISTDQAFDHFGSYVLFAHLITLFQTIVSIFKIALLQICPNLNYTNKTPLNLYIADFKQPLLYNCTILMLHIIPIVNYTQLAFKWTKMWPCVRCRLKAPAKRVQHFIQHHTTLMFYEMLHSFGHLVVSCFIVLYRVV